MKRWICGQNYWAKSSWPSSLHRGGNKTVVNIRTTVVIFALRHRHPAFYMPLSAKLPTPGITHLCADLRYKIRSRASILFQYFCCFVRFIYFGCLSLDIHIPIVKYTQSERSEWVRGTWLLKAELGRDKLIWHGCWNLEGVSAVVDEHRVRQKRAKARVKKYKSWLSLLSPGLISSAWQRRSLGFLAWPAAWGRNGDICNSLHKRRRD